MSIPTARLKLHAFTFIEILIVVTIVGLMVIPLFITYNSSRANRALDASAEEVVNNTTSAHIFARTARDQKNWGVKNLTDKTYAIVSKGKGPVEISKRYSLEPGVKFDKNFQILFDIGTGETKKDEEIKLVNDNGISKTVKIFATGVVEVEAIK